MTDLALPKENEDYELIPLVESEFEDAWGVRLLTGTFTETVLVYGRIAFNEEQDHMTFDFEVQSSPDSELSTENEELQQHAANVLQSVIVRAIEEGTLDLKEKE